MNIVDALKTQNIRLSYQDKWLVWDESLEKWVVYYYVYRKGTSVLVETSDEEVAVDWLLT